MSKYFSKVIDAQNALYRMCGFEINHLTAENESEEYSAHYYTLGNKHVRFRIAKQTPTKIGRFVTMWKRKPDGIISPYDILDQVDFFVINLMHESRVGQFVFPKSILVEKNIFSRNDKGGKRAIRVYSPWDEVNSTQAISTKKWQIQYFSDITSGNSIDIEKIKRLYST